MQFCGKSFKNFHECSQKSVKMQKIFTSECFRRWKTQVAKSLFVLIVDFDAFDASASSPFVASAMTVAGFRVYWTDLSVFTLCSIITWKKWWICSYLSIVLSCWYSSSASSKALNAVGSSNLLYTSCFSFSSPMLMISYSASSPSSLSTLSGCFLTFLSTM